MIVSSRSVLLVLLGSLLFATPALATTVHGNFSGTTIDFLGVQETTNSADPEPLYEVPFVAGDSLLFSPSAYTSFASGLFGFDQTDTLLEMTLSAQVGGVIDTIQITETGVTTLNGSGTAGTSGLITLQGTYTITEQNFSPITNVIGVWSATFDQDLFSLPGDSGDTFWTGTALIDIGSVVPNATEVVFDLDNVLFTGSEDGTDALMQKTLLSISVPEPSSLALIGLGLLAAAASGRRRDR